MHAPGLPGGTHTSPAAGQVPRPSHSSSGSTSTWVPFTTVRVPLTLPAEPTRDPALRMIAPPSAASAVMGPGPTVRSPPPVSDTLPPAPRCLPPPTLMPALTVTAPVPRTSHARPQPDP